MSFSDMLQSGRGPGVIGMLMALVVLVGFGVLFVFAFDEGLQGGQQTIEALIKNQGQEIDSYQRHIVDGEKKLATAPAKIAAAKELGRVKRENQAQIDTSAALKSKIEAVNADLVAKKDAFEAYKNQYRANVRSKARGESMPQLETRSGAVYRNVSIREVTPIGIQIRHDEGQKRIPFEELPDAMVDYYQFDPSQKAAALVDEHATRNQHEAAAAVANDQADQVMAQQREKDAQAKKEKTLREIETKKALIGTLQEDIKQLNQNIQQAAAEAASARAAGHIHINKSSSILGDIRSKQNRIAALRSEISQISAGVR